MNIAYRCPDCGATAAVTLASDATHLACPACHTKRPLPAKAWDEGKLTRCLVCPCDDVFVRKDFSQSLGIGIVVFGVVVSSISWYFRVPLGAYATLFSTALLDFGLYFICGNLLECYRCHAQYRDVPGLDEYEPFNLETHERHRQQAARLG
jgi:DNA-directed RNA polymerase subunit RPC12/RpoP